MLTDGQTNLMTPIPSHCTLLFSNFLQLTTEEKLLISKEIINVELGRLDLLFKA